MTENQYQGRPCVYGHTLRDKSKSRCVECRKAQAVQERARYRQRYPGRMAESNKRYRATHQEGVRAYEQRRPKRPKEVRRLKRAVRRARILGQAGVVSSDIVSRLLAWQRGRCAACQQDLQCLPCYDLDHVEPLALGGLHTDSNLQLLCPMCNRQKGAKPPIVFMQARGYVL